MVCVRVPREYIQQIQQLIGCYLSHILHTLTLHCLTYMRERKRKGEKKKRETPNFSSFSFSLAGIILQ